MALGEGTLDNSCTIDAAVWAVAVGEFWKPDCRIHREIYLLLSYFASTATTTSNGLAQLGSNSLGSKVGRVVSSMGKLLSRAPTSMNSVGEWEHVLVKCILSTHHYSIPANH